MWNFPLLPERASTLAGNVDLMMAFVFAVLVFFSVLIAGLLLFFVLKYHHTTAADRTEPPTFDLRIELTWTAVPLALTALLFVWGARIFIAEHQPPADALDIYVVGKQWMWKIEHPQGQREINELHVPVGYPVRLVMTSQDVIHSFFIPAFRVKQDVLPGRYTSLWFQATRPGDYPLFCSQYCGTAHAAMNGHVVVMTPADYEKWLGSATAGPLSLDGEKLFTRYGCAACHAQGAPGGGPALAGLYGRPVRLSGGRTVLADEDYLRASILEPRANVVEGYASVMPTFQGQLDEDQVLQLVSYIKSLKGGSL